MAKPVHLTSAIDLFSKSYEVVMRNLKSFAVLLALPALASLISAFHYRIRGAGASNWQHFNPFSSTVPGYALLSLVGAGLLIVFLLAALVSLLIQAMLTVLELEGAQDKTPSLQQLWQGGKKYWLRLFGLTMAIALYFIMAAVAGLVIFLPFLLFHKLDPAIFLYSVWLVIALLFIIQNYFLAPYVLVDQDKPIYEALHQSAKLSKHHARHIWSIIGVIFLLGITGGLPFIGPIISFVLGSFYLVAPALRYFELKKLA